MDGKNTKVGSCLLVGDIQVMARFYRDVLGFETDWDGGDFAELRTASGYLSLFMYSRKPFTEAFGWEYEPPKGINQSFEIGLWQPSYADVDAEFARLKELGANLQSEAPITYPFGIRNFYVADPEGNLLEIGSWNAD